MLSGTRRRHGRGFRFIFRYLLRDRGQRCGLAVFFTSGFRRRCLRCLWRHGIIGYRHLLDIGRGLDLIFRILEPEFRLRHIYQPVAILGQHRLFFDQAVRKTFHRQRIHIEAVLERNAQQFGQHTCLGRHAVAAGQE